MKLEEYKSIISYLRGVIEGSPFEGHVYSVGGCERDKILGKEIKDIDLVVDLSNGGINFAKWLEGKGLTKSNVVTYEHYGTAMFHLKAFPNEELEAVQTRKECYRDINTRNPDTAFGTIMDDCTRRDFTINAIYHNISTDEDLDLNGKSFEDLKGGTIRACDDPGIIFNEDPLRIMRAIRFASRLNYTIEEKTTLGMKMYADRLKIISQERITDEFNKSLNADMISTLHKYYIFGIDKVIFPEITEEEYSKIKDLCHLFQRRANLSNLYNFKMMPKEKRYIAALSIIVHEIGRERGEKLLRRMKYSNDEIKDAVFFATSIDDMLFINGFKEKKQETMLRTITYLCKSVETYRFLGDIVRAYGINFRYPKHPMYCYELPINGNDVMAELNIGPSKEVKEWLDKVLATAMRHPEITKEQCIQVLHGKDPFKKNIFRRLYERIF